jgi:hypothetical protein
VVDEDTRDILERSDQVTPEHLLLIDAILTLLKTSLENENRRRIVVVNTIIAYYGVEEGPASRRIQRRRPVKDNSPLVLKAKEPNTLSQAIRSIKKEKRPTKCFVYLGNLSLTLGERVALYTTSGSLSRHFLRKYIRRLQGGVYIDCRFCGVRLEDQVQLLIHAEKFHGTVSRGPAERLIT